MIIKEGASGYSALVRIMSTHLNGINSTLDTSSMVPTIMVTRKVIQTTHPPTLNEIRVSPN